ncbi:uncharacterized protein [Lolium perenne]|uniref:uncharacterized protein n=1 Tax=Lolium perenne TaxID=4522 RepID=UPI003A9A1866
MPYITFFGNKLCGSEVLSEHDIFVCFMVVAISCFLCPNLREYPNNKYLSVLRFPEAARQYDFSKLVYECCLESISEFSMLGKLKGRRLRAPVCCNYVLVVHYLDCFDFGRKNVEQTTPRIKVWKGSMIRVFSELDRKRRHCFGKRHLKEVLATCRAQGVFSSDVNHRKTQSPIFDPVSFKFRDNVQNRFVSNLRPDVIDGILNTIENFVSNKSSTKPKIEVLVTNVLDFLSNSRTTPSSVDKVPWRRSN